MKALPGLNKAGLGASKLLDTGADHARLEGELLLSSERVDLA